MKYKLLSQLLVLSRSAMYGILINCFILSLTLAGISEAQSVQSVKDVRIYLDLKNSSLIELFEAIERQTNFHFSYNSEDIMADLKISKRYSQATVAEILLDISKLANLKFKQVNQNINVSKSNSGRNERQLEIIIQSRTVSGKVTSAEDGEPLPGVNILEKGSANGVVSDVDGRYQLTVAENATLVFSIVGFARQEIEVGNRSIIDVAMSTDVRQLEELVVVGYGAIKKTDLTGSVAVIESEEIVKRGSVNPIEGMQGQVAGVDISNSDGRAGSGFTIQIRGQQSFQGGEPLYVVDGVITSDISFLNPQNIERIDILKDASSTAIYGSRGAYGVVYVTTRQGANVRDKAVISYDGYVGLRKAVRLPNFMPGDKWWNYRQDSFITQAIMSRAPIPANPGDNSRNSNELRRRLEEKDFTDWPALLIRDGAQSNHWLSISGSGNDLGYTFGAGYQVESGNVVHEKYKQYNLKASIDHKLSNSWQAGANFNFALTEEEQGSPNAMVNAFRMPPLLHPYATGTKEIILQPGKDIVGSGASQVVNIDFTSSVNPLVDMENANREVNQHNILGNVYLQFSPVEWLSVKSTFSPDYRSMERGLYLGNNTEGRLNRQPRGELERIESFSYFWDNQLNIVREFNKHRINLMGLFSTNMFRIKGSLQTQDAMPFTATSFYSIGSGDISSLRSDTDYSKENIISYAVRLNYVLADRYLVTLTSRWDGASVLASKDRWSSFPSAALGWMISEENFMNGAGFVDQLKARISYGFTGNKVVNPYQTSAFADTDVYYDFNGTLSPGLIPENMANSSLTWERTGELNIGLDFGLFNSIINGSIEVYNKLSKDLIITRDLPLETGFPDIIQNVGEVRNKGFEISLTTLNLNTNDISWTTTFNFAKNKNEIVELYGGAVELIQDDNMIWRVGAPLNSHYNYVFDGIWQADESELAEKYGQRPGMAKVKDFDNNNSIDPSDRRILGSTLPDWTGGFSTSFTFKSFDLSASLISRQGVLVFSRFHQEFLNFDDRGRAKLDFDWYMEPNPITQERVSNKYPQPRGAGAYWNSNGVGFYKDASFVKVKNIGLGYTLPESLIDRAGISSLRIYANVLNPFVFTKYDGFDPEWAGATYADGGMSSTTYQLGLNLKF